MAALALTRLRGPLAESYAGAVALVVCALVPFLALTASLAPLTKLIGHDLHLGTGALDLTIGMSDAGYAFGTVLAVQFAQHLPQRRMLLLYVAIFVVAAFVAAAAPSRGLFIAALVVEGLCTSLMLIAAVPPLVIGFGADRIATTGVIMNLCIFGAVAAGPTLGSAFSAVKDWRLLFWVVAAISVLALVFAVLTFEDADPQDTSAPWDTIAIVLAAAGCAASFFGAAELELHGRATALALVSLGVGIALIAVLIVYQYRSDEPLVPVEQLATTKPVFGIVVALAASACAFGLMDLTLAALAQASPSHTALLFLPELGAAVLTAAFFGLLFRTRYTPVYAFGGILVLAAAAAVLTGVASGADWRIALGSGLLGLGVGAAVSPGLFIAGFSLASEKIQRVFALIELLRGVGAFLFAPILLYLLRVFSPHRPTAVADAAWVCLGVAAAGAAVGAAVWVLGRAQLDVPDLEQWQDEGDPAWQSPPLLDRLR